MGYFVAIRNTNSGSKNVLEDLDTPFVVLKNDAKYWTADPFVFEKDGKTYIFAELFDYKLQRGTIGYCEYNGNPKVKWKQIIVEPYHMSFPFVLEKSGYIYLMPETSCGSCVSLYKCISFPDKWEKCENILENDNVVDTVLFDYLGKDLAFTYDSYGFKDAENNLWLCDVVDNKIIKKIPITKDVAIARMAGKVFTYDHKYYRPSQYCVDYYGQALNIMEFVIGDNGYEEKLIKRIFPKDIVFTDKKDFIGIHTYNTSQNFEVIDAKTSKGTLLSYIGKILKRVSRLRKQLMK